MPIIKEQNLKNDIELQDFRNVYLIYGEEKYLVGVYTQMLKRAVLGKDYLDFNFNQFSSEAVVEDIYDALVALPVMSERKLVLVKDMDFTALSEDTADKYCEMIRQVPGTAVLIFSQPTNTLGVKKTAAAKKVFKAITDNGAALELNKKKKTQISDQLIRWAQKRGNTLSYRNADRIVEYSSGDYMSISKELEKLCAYCVDREITQSDIEIVMTKSFTANVFELSKAVCAGRYSEAYSKLEMLLDDREEPIMIVAVLSSAFVDMYRVKTVGKNEMGMSELLENFAYRNKEFRLRNAKVNASNLSLEQIGLIIEELLQTDVKLKSARGDRRVLMESLLSRIIMIKSGKARSWA